MGALHAEQIVKVAVRDGNSLALECPPLTCWARIAPMKRSERDCRVNEQRYGEMQGILRLGEWAYRDLVRKAR